MQHDRFSHPTGSGRSARNRADTFLEMSAAIDLPVDVDSPPRPRIAAKVLLQLARTLAFVFFSMVALGEILLVIPLVRKERRLVVRATWLHLWCRFACRVLGIHRVIRGPMPRSGLLVCNHLSYIDIVVLSSFTPCVFVAKRDVSGWPLFGWLARAAGTIFVDRRRRLAARDAVESMQKAIRNGALVVIFPEGTSSDGVTVLPFKSALLEPALELGCRVTAGAIDYSLPYGGSVGDEVCYWRDMTLAPHLLNFFAKPRVEVRLTISQFQPRGDRKRIACELRDQIAKLRS